MKQASLEGFNDAEKAAVRKFLFQAVDGHGKQGKTVWRRFWSRILKAEIGEMFRFITKQDRSGPYHRRTFAILQAVFDAQDRFHNFEQYLNWVKVGAAWVDWVAGPKGGIVPLPRSVSYSEADQDEFMQFTAQVMDFFRCEYAPRYLWRHLKPEQAGEMMRTIMGGFQE